MQDLERGWCAEKIRVWSLFRNLLSCNLEHSLEPLLRRQFDDPLTGPWAGLVNR